MKTTIVTIVLISLMVSSAAMADIDSTRSNPATVESFNARVSDIQGDTLTFTVMNPERDKVVLKVYSDRDLKVMHYNAGRKKAVRLYYLMENMRPCTYTAVVERNGKEILSKKIDLDW